MPVTEDRLARLQRFGLSEYAARAYLALLDLGAAEARDISAIGRVPMGKIYHALDQLHEEGLVVVHPESPKRYSPIPFDEYLGKLQRSHTEAIRSLERERAELGDLFRILGTTEVGNRGGFSILRGRRNVGEKVQEMLEEASRDWLVLAVSGLARRYVETIPDLRRARARGLRLRFLVPLTKELCPRLAPLTECSEVRHREVDEGSPGSNVSLIIADGTRALLINHVPNDDAAQSGRDVAIFTDQKAIVDAIRGLAEPHWGRAPTYAERCEELATGRTTSYARILHTPEEAMGLMRTLLDLPVREVSYVNAGAAGALPDEEGQLLLAHLRRSRDRRVRWIHQFNDRAAAEAHARLMAEHPGLECRHLAPVTISRFWLADDVEACFSLIRPEVADGTAGEARVPDLLMATNRREVLRSLRTHFEELWARATPLAERLRELQ